MFANYIQNSTQPKNCRKQILFVNEPSCIFCKSSINEHHKPVKPLLSTSRKHWVQANAFARKCNPLLLHRTLNSFLVRRSLYVRLRKYSFPWESRKVFLRVARNTSCTNVCVTFRSAFTTKRAFSLSVKVLRSRRSHSLFGSRSRFFYVRFFRFSFLYVCTQVKKDNFSPSRSLMYFISEIFFQLHDLSI